MSMLRTMLVDGNRLARAHLRSLLSFHDEIELIGEAGGVQEAVQLVEERNPDLIFLDVHLPYGEGFSLLPKLTRIPRLIIVSDTEHHAVRAFSVNAIDYLLKPIKPDRLAQSISRLKHTFALRQNESGHLDVDPIIIYDAGRIHFLPVEKIGAILAEGNFTRVHIAGQENLFLRRSLAKWEKILSARSFYRLDRTAIFNFSLIRQITRISRDEALVRIEGISQAFSLGRTAMLRLEERLAREGLVL